MTFNIEEFQNRFKERAEAVKNRPMPPIGGDERLAFIKQAEKDYQDYMIISDSEFEITEDYLVHIQSANCITFWQNRSSLFFSNTNINSPVVGIL